MRFILLLLFFCMHQAMAGSALTVLSLKHNGPSPRGVNQLAGEINMPFVQAADKVLAAKINDQLFIAQFGMLAPAPGAIQFTAPDDISLSGIASLDFSVSRNDERILTIVLDIEGCGAYCESYQTVYSFDVKTGRQILVKDLISASGMQQLLRRAKAGQAAAWRRQLASLHDDLKAARKKHITGYALQDLQSRIELNSRCLGDGGHTDRTPGQAESVATFDYLKTELAADGFKVTLERCSNHALRALDDVADFTLKVNYAELTPLLTRYGKAVLAGDSKVAQAPGVFGQLLNGSIGQAAVTMKLVKDADNSVRGLYFYRKYRKAIQLIGRLQGDELELAERIDEQEAGKTVMRLQVLPASLRGRWLGEPGLDVILAP